MLKKTTLPDYCDLNDIQATAIYEVPESSNEPIHIHLLTHRDYRRSTKKLRAQINGYYRRKRYAKRQKERARRRKLKGARYT